MYGNGLRSRLIANAQHEKTLDATDGTIFMIIICAALSGMCLTHFGTKQETGDAPILALLLGILFMIVAMGLAAVLKWLISESLKHAQPTEAAAEPPNII